MDRKYSFASFSYTFCRSWLIFLNEVQGLASQKKKKKNYLLDNIDWLVFLIVVYTGKKRFKKRTKFMIFTLLYANK